MNEDFKGNNVAPGNVGRNCRFFIVHGLLQQMVGQHAMSSASVISCCKIEVEIGFCV